MTRYQTMLLMVLIVWPFAILALLFFMSRLERYVQRLDARTPQEAGIEPVAGEAPEREVRIVVGDQVVGERSDTDPHGRRRDAPDVAAT
ncbi:MAG: hypothetical protein GEU78_12580 [Actinobacteria bacterium]|nr:hypothetical protein [Actinomycetota bacterium]